jgi:hypothetical protein
MAKAKKIPPNKASARLKGPVDPRNGAEVCALTKEQVAAVQNAADYPNQPKVQAAAVSLLNDNAKLQKTLNRIAALRTRLIHLEATRDTQIDDVLKGRRNLQTTITVVCAGVVEAIKAWGAGVATWTVGEASTEPPVDLRVANHKSIVGTIVLQVGAIAGVTMYLFHVSGEPDAEPGADFIISPRTKYPLAGQQPGKVLYVRAAVHRRRGGQSRWSDAVSITVR